MVGTMHNLVVMVYNKATGKHLFLLNIREK